MLKEDASPEAEVLVNGLRGLCLPGHNTRFIFWCFKAHNISLWHTDTVQLPVSVLLLSQKAVEVADPDDVSPPSHHSQEHSPEN